MHIAVNYFSPSNIAFKRLEDITVIIIIIMFGFPPKTKGSATLNTEDTVLTKEQS